MRYQSEVQGGSNYYFSAEGTQIHVGVRFLLILYLQGPPRFLDTACIDDNTSDATTPPTRRGFRAALIERDKTCVVTNQPPQVCKGAHYYPHSKGGEVR